MKIVATAVVALAGATGLCGATTAFTHSIVLGITTLVIGTVWAFCFVALLVGIIWEG